MPPHTPGFDTHAIHAGYEPDHTMGAINIPIYASTTFAQNAPNDLRGGYEYGRVANPTVASLARSIATLEGGQFGSVFASGMAATDTLLRALLRPGDHLIMGHDAYGGTYRLIDAVLRQWAIEFTVVDTTSPQQVAAALQENTKAVWLETPTNPMLAVTDIQAVATAIKNTVRSQASEVGTAPPEKQEAGNHGRQETQQTASLGESEGQQRGAAAHGNWAPPRVGAGGAALIVDNTFASPYLQRPLDLGADVVVHSTTKYIGGHSDVVGGALVHNSAALHESLDFLLGGVGPIMSPFDAYLTARGLKTLGVRMDRHCANAQRIAEYLDARPEVKDVFYPGLEHHPGHEVAARQGTGRGFGGMITVRMGSAEAAVALCQATQLFCLAESLGGVESLLEHPASMTHQSVAGSQIDVPQDIVRLSVGIETVEDLIADLDAALGRIAR